MAIIAVYSPKGGVGKSTISSDIAYRSAKLGRKNTLLWDFDTEGGSGFLLGADQAQNIRSSRVFEKVSSVTNHIQTTGHKKLSYLGLSSELHDFASSLQRLGPNQRLPELLSFAHRSFDRLVLDCPPVRNELSKQILSAADLLLVPLPVSPLAARALHHVQDDLAKEGRTNLPVLPVFSMYDSRRSAHRSAREDWMQPYPVVPYSTDVEQIAFRRQMIDEFAQRSPAAQALNMLWRGLEKRIRDDEAKQQKRQAGAKVQMPSQVGKIVSRFAGADRDSTH